jgi:hypothetical protein
MHTDGIAGRTVSGSAKESGGSPTFFQTVPRMLERRFRHSHVDASHRARQKPRLLEPPFILHLRSDSFFTQKLAEPLGFFRAIKGGQRDPDIRNVRGEW